MQSAKHNERLLIGVLGKPHSGKSHTWNVLFERAVMNPGTKRVKLRAGVKCLELRPGEKVGVFLVNGSVPEEQKKIKTVEEILQKMPPDIKIVLCSMRYPAKVQQTLDYFIDNRYYLYLQWLNPGHDGKPGSPVEPGLVKVIRSSDRAVVSVRDGRYSANAKRRVQEIREFIYGWALYRGLIITGR